MVSVQKVEDGVRWGSITYFYSTQFAVYYGVTHDPQNPFVVEYLDLQWHWCALVTMFMSAVAVI